MCIWHGHISIGYCERAREEAHRCVDVEVFVYILHATLSLSFSLVRCMVSVCLCSVSSSIGLLYHVQPTVPSKSSFTNHCLHATSDGCRQTFHSRYYCHPHCSDTDSMPYFKIQNAVTHFNGWNFKTLRWINQRFFFSIFYQIFHSIDFIIYSMVFKKKIPTPNEQ